jgi:hypothetical protein
LIPDELLEELAIEMNVNYQTKKLTWETMFKLILMWLLDGNNVTQRALSSIYSSPEFSTFADTWKQEVKHNTIWARLNNMPYTYFEKLFQILSDKYGSYLEESITSTKIIIKRFDSTLVWFSEKLLKFWMKAWSPKERHIKFTVWLDWYIPTKVNVYTKQEASSEDIALWETILEEINKKNEVIVFDRWVQRRETYSKLIDKDISFVTRLKKNTKYEVVKIHKEVKWREAWELVLEWDEIIKLFWIKWKKLEKELRLIVAYKWDEKYVFLTNILELNAREITDIYARRWDIEVFFKFIKQEFWFSHFVSRSENWIKNMLYMTLIATILIIVYKKKNKISWYKEAKRQFIAELNELLLIDLTIATWWDIRILKRDYLRYYSS